MMTEIHLVYSDVATLYAETKILMNAVLWSNVGSLTAGFNVALVEIMVRGGHKSRL